MKLRELIGVIAWQPRPAGEVLADAAGLDPEWQQFAGAVDMNPDEEVPDGLIRAALAEMELPLVWERGFLRPRGPESLAPAQALPVRAPPALEPVTELPQEEPVPERDITPPGPEESQAMESQTEEWDGHDEVAEESTESWNWRPLLLAAIGLATGLLAHWITKDIWGSDNSQVQLTALVALIVTAGLIGFTIQRRLWWASLLFAVLTGGVAAAVTWWNGPPNIWASAEGWRLVSLGLAIAIAAPLFQAARDEEDLSFPYAAVHDHAWTNIVLWCAGWAFVAIVWVLMWLLASLFDLIQLHFLRDLLQKEWFASALIGLAFGTGLGVLRDHDFVVRLLQRVVATVLAVLAPVLALGLVVFVGALPFTGLGALWDATNHATPVLLTCVIGALILANAVIGNAEEHESRLSVLRWGALALAVVMVPLVALSALGTWLRIDQYGFTPQRLWAATFVGLAALYALSYWWSLIRGRLEWPAVARPANLALAFVVFAVALLLATPLVSFNAISTRDQVARLEAGRIAPDKFDWAALAFDFGKPGREALEKLKSSANAAIKARATEVAKSESRWDVRSEEQRTENAEKVAVNLRILPAGAKLPDGLSDAVAGQYECTRDRKCTALLVGSAEAIVIDDACYAAPEPTPTPAPSPAPADADKVVVVDMPATVMVTACGGGTRYALVGKEWKRADSGSGEASNPATAAYKEGKIEVRTVPRRQLFVGGVPVGGPFE